MENNNAVSAHGPDDEVKVDVGEEPSSRERGNRPRRQQPYNRENRLEDETGKWAIRRKIWDYLEDNNLVNAPRPCHYRIPNFESAAAANEKLANLDVFKRAKTVKVNPDKPQEQARFLVLQAGKELVLLNQSQRYLLSSQSHKRSGLLVQVVPPEGADNDKLLHCCTSQGVKEFSSEVDPEEKIKIDLLIVGSVAVSRNGLRIGKGKGFADLEYAMMRTLGAIDANTVVVTSVHDSQIVDIPEDLVGEHDLTVDYILTPTEIIETKCNRPKPAGVVWSHLEVNKFFQIPVLKQLRDLEHESGRNVFLKGQENEEDDPLENIEPPRPRRFRRYGRGGSYRGRGRPFRYRRGGGSRRRTDDDSNKENVETGDESGADGDNDGRGRRRNFRSRRFNSRGKPRSYESEHSDGGGDSGQGDGEEKGNQRRYPNRRRFQRRRRYDGGNRRDNRGGGDHSGSDGEQKTSGDEEEVRRPQRQRFRSNPNTIVWVGGLSRRLRVSELKTELRALHVNPLRLVWRGARGFAFIHFQSTDSAKEAVNVLSGKELDGKEIKVEMANNDRPPRRRGDYRGSSKEDNPASDQVEVGDR